MEENSDLIYIQIKNLVYENTLSKYNLINYFSPMARIEINSDRKYSFSSYYSISKLKKMNNERFCLITTSKSFFELYVILFDLYNSDSNIFIRYYNIPLRFYDIREFNYLESINYNGFLGILYTNKKVDWYAPQNYFSILSYIKGIDSSLITLDITTTIVLNDYINENNIENNVFGVIFHGIKIIKLPVVEGLYYFSEKTNNIISENDILESDDVIRFAYDYDILIKGEIEYNIEMAGVVREPNYSDFNKYPEKTEYYGTETQESYFNPREFVGKSSFY